MPAHLVCLCDAQLRAPVLCFAQEQSGSTPSTNDAHTHAHTHTRTQRMEWPHHVNNILAPFTLILPPKDAAHSAHQEHCAGRHLATPGAHAPGDEFFYSRGEGCSGYRRRCVHGEHKYCGRRFVPRLA